MTLLLPMRLRRGSPTLLLRYVLIRRSVSNFLNIVFKGIQLKASMPRNDFLFPNSGSYANFADCGVGVDLAGDMDERYPVPEMIRANHVDVHSSTQSALPIPSLQVFPSIKGPQLRYHMNSLSTTPSPAQSSHTLGQEHRSSPQQCIVTGLTSLNTNFSRGCTDNGGQHGQPQPLDRLDPRRQKAPRLIKGSHGMPTHHNHVDIHRIGEGTDVRTTASPPCHIFRTGASLNRFPDHASEYPEQGRPDYAQAYH